MEYYVQEVKDDYGTPRTAGIKARDDLEKIWSDRGYTPIRLDPLSCDRDSANFYKKYRLHKLIARMWEESLAELISGDELCIQLPPVNHSIYLRKVLSALKNRGVRLVGVIHDLDCLRMSKLNSYSLKQRLRIKLEEESILPCFTKIIVHNVQMKNMLSGQGIPESVMVPLEIFDYLLSKDCGIDERERIKSFSGEREIIIAGNLDTEKAGYITKLPPGVEYNLYGVNNILHDNHNKNIHYMGSYAPDELPFCLQGHFGLVWDGDSVKTCDGVYGEYLRINNPHKTSLYLVSGLPVIIWKEAALADFIEKNNLGFTVDRLDEIPLILKRITIEEYASFCENVKKQSVLLKKGHYTNSAMEKL